MMLESVSRYYRARHYVVYVLLFEPGIYWHVHRRVSVEGEKGIGISSGLMVLRAIGW